MTTQASHLPSFCWDRNWSYEEVRRRLERAQGRERDQLVAWILREASLREVWMFVTPAEVAEALPRITWLLGRRRGFWSYIVGVWRELGKL